MGGGAKKKSIAMAEKAQQRATTKEGEEKKESTGAKTGPKSVAVGDDLMKTLRKEAPKMNAVTPYVIASKYNLRLSSAKAALKQLEKESLLRKASGNRRVTVYAPPSAKPEQAAAS